jgi:hypothetical protein
VLLFLGKTFMPKSSRRRIHADFREAFVLTDVRAGDLAATAGLSRSQLSRLMNAPAVVATPRTVERLRTLAGLLWYPPDRIFAERQP